MANPSKAKGTAAETAIVKYLREHGHPFAERRALAGNKDKGDIALPGIVVEVKDCVRLELAKWVAEANQEAANAEVPVGVCWFKRKGTTDPGRWYVLMDGATFTELTR